MNSLYPLTQLIPLLLYLNFLRWPFVIVSPRGIYGNGSSTAHNISNPTGSETSLSCSCSFFTYLFLTAAVRLHYEPGLPAKVEYWKVMGRLMSPFSFPLHSCSHSNVP